MDDKKIIQELISQYELKLKEDDPIFAGLFLNKIVLREYLSEFETHLAESITNVAIKEDVALHKLQKLFNEIQIKNRQENERTLNQFADNLKSELHSLLNQNSSQSPKPWLWCIICLFVGLIIGLITEKFF